MQKAVSANRINKCLIELRKRSPTTISHPISCWGASFKDQKDFNLCLLEALCLRRELSAHQHSEDHKVINLIVAVSIIAESLFCLLLKKGFKTK